jgi:hypothetical protein
MWNWTVFLSVWKSFLIITNISVSSQNVLIHKGVVGLISRFLKKGPTSKMFHSSACLLSFVCQGNSLGQNKARLGGIITVLMSCLRSGDLNDNLQFLGYFLIHTLITSLFAFLIRRSKTQGSLYHAEGVWTFLNWVNTYPSHMHCKLII